MYVRTSSLGTEGPTLDGLQAAASYLRSTLGRILRLRRIPELRFRIDLSQELAQLIEELLSEIDTLVGAEESEDDST